MGHLYGHPTSMASHADLWGHENNSPIGHFLVATTSAFMHCVCDGKPIVALPSGPTAHTKGMFDMAKSKKTETAPVVSNTEVPSTIGHGDFTVELASLNSKALHYLANYGLNKSLQDAVAGRKGELKATKVTLEDGTVTEENKYSETEIAVIIHDEQKARFTAILEGTIGTRASGAPKPSKLETVIGQVAMERMRAGAIRLGKSLPKGEQLATLKAAYTAKNLEALTAEAERRMASRSAEAGDLAELLG
jgi:hypothetical protein